LSKRLIAMLAGVVAIAVIAAGCGSSSSSDSLTKAEYIKQGDALCKKGSGEIEEEVETYAKENNISLKSEPSEEQLEAISEDVVIPAVQSQLDGLKGLGTPSEDEDKSNEVLDALEEGIEKGEEDPAAFVEGKGTLVKANELANEFGFKVCGQE
jgi:hypothetical protein